jgi:hypothetical protein
LSAHLPSADLSGSVYYDVDVPDFTKGALVMSGAMLTVTPMVVAAPRDLLSNIMPIVPTTNRYFTKKTDQAGRVCFALSAEGQREAGRTDHADHRQRWHRSDHVTDDAAGDRVWR